MSGRLTWTSEMDAKFFDAIADGDSIADAAARVGATIHQGRERFKYIRKCMGEQGQ